MIKIFTDGSCSGNPGPGGYALIIVKANEVFEIRQEFAKETTNNRMELLAVRDAIIYCLENNIEECKIYTDSQYALNGITVWAPSWKKKGWTGSKNKMIKNLQIWMELEGLWAQAKKTLNISIHYVKGHSDSKFNNLADEKAREIVTKYAKNREE